MGYSKHSTVLESKVQYSSSGSATCYLCDIGHIHIPAFSVFIHEMTIVISTLQVREDYIRQAQMCSVNKCKALSW